MKEVDILLKKFRPVFGNEKHRLVAERIGKMLYLRKKIEADNKKIEQISNLKRKKTAKEKTLEQLEYQVAEQLKSL